jgi:hypothetical protein
MLLAMGAGRLSRLAWIGAAAWLALAPALAACGGGGGGSMSTPPAPPPPPPPPPPAQPTLQALTSQPPGQFYLAMLLTDGTVLVQGDGTSTSAAVFYRLTPDANGSYLNGTWTKVSSPPAGYAPYAGAEAMLADGRALFVGGEYNQDNYSLPFAPSGLTNMSAVYDPVADKWTMIPAPPGVPYIGDVPCVVLPNGTFVYGDKLGRSMWALNPATLAWSPIAATGKNDNFAEEGFTLLPNGTFLTVDMVDTPQSEHFVIAGNAWVQDGPTPSLLASPTDYPSGLTFGPAPQQTVGGVTYGPGPTGTYFPPGEIGPAILRPDGSVFYMGSASSGPGHTAVYRPGASASAAGSWTAGPDFPSGDNAGDSSAALLPDGNVLVAGDSGALYEFDGTSLKATFSGPKGGASVFLLPLPSGQVLVLLPGFTPNVSLYTPVGSPQAGWAPTISQVPSQISRGQSYQLSGTQLNGLSQASAYGDELNSATNYPLVLLTNAASRHVVYARTHGHSSMGVATGSATVSTTFDVPANAETGATTLVVIANGIASAPANVTVN